MKNLGITRLQDQSRVTVAGHRGYSAKYPENTLLSFQKALDLGVDMIELDLRRTKDNVIVIMHDATVDRTTDGSGDVAEFTLEEMGQLDAGSWFDPAFSGLRVPTLEEFIDLIKPYPDLLLNVEIKERTKDIVDEAVAVLDEADLLSRCVFTCFDARIVEYLHDKYGLKTQGFLGGKMHNFDGHGLGTYSKMWAAGIEMGILTSKLVHEFEEMGILPWSYCPDTEEQVVKSIEAGVSLMTCNDPEPALRILEERGLR